MDWEAEFQRNQGIYNDVEPMDIAQDRPPSPDGTLPVFQEAPTEESTLEQLMRHWMNERYCHDILPAQEGLLGRILDHIRHQVGSASIRSLDASNLLAVRRCATSSW